MNLISEPLKLYSVAYLLKYKFKLTIISSERSRKIPWWSDNNYLTSNNIVCVCVCVCVCGAEVCDISAG